MPEDEAPFEDVAVAIVRRDGRVLVRIRRESGALDGTLEFPGGRRRPGEAPADAAVRETREETGLAVIPGAILDVVEHTYPDRRVRIAFVETACAADAEPAGGWHWVTPAELRRARTPAANAGIIAAL